MSFEKKTREESWLEKIEKRQNEEFSGGTHGLFTSRYQM